MNPPKCKWCHSQNKDLKGYAPIFHPNIDLKGNVCLNILSFKSKVGWSPVNGI